MSAKQNFRAWLRRGGCKQEKGYRPKSVTPRFFLGGARGFEPPTLAPRAISPR
jgi:hypothetical protein